MHPPFLREKLRNSKKTDVSSTKLALNAGYICFFIGRSPRARTAKLYEMLFRCMLGRNKSKSTKLALNAGYICFFIGRSPRARTAKLYELLF